MLISKTRVKMQEKRKNNARKLANAGKRVKSILHNALGKNARHLHFGMRFGTFETQSIV